jgi:molybdopterin molybdotransferase
MPSRAKRCCSWPVPCPRPAGAAGALHDSHSQAPGRSEFQRGIVDPRPTGGWQVRLTGSQGAGVLRSMSEANALVVLGHEQGSVAEGELVDVWLFEGLA